MAVKATYVLNCMQFNGKDFKRVTLVNNAGSLGDLSKTVSEYQDLGDISAYISLNLTSVVVLTYVCRVMLDG